MKRVALTLMFALTITACATPDRAGVRNPEFFRRVATQSTIESQLPPTEVARCFEARATLLPMSRFEFDEPSGRTTYRLRGFGYTFEEIDFEQTQTGSRMTIFVAPNVNARWREDFARDRGAPLNQCAEVSR